MRKGMRILIAYDGSEPSKHALDQGISLANLTESEVTILSVVPTVMMPVFSEAGMGAPVSSAQQMADYHEEMKEYYSNSLEKVSEDIKGDYPNLKVETKLIEGRTSQTIVDMAEDDSFDLIVIGSRGIGGITGWILGSTSRRVVESCTVPVLVIK
jgi:nucleotide-binding universal stress UspA family protein